MHVCYGVDEIKSVWNLCSMASYFCYCCFYVCRHLSAETSGFYGLVFSNVCFLHTITYLHVLVTPFVHRILGKHKRINTNSSQNSPKSESNCWHFFVLFNVFLIQILPSHSNSTEVTQRHYFSAGLSLYTVIWRK